MRTSLGTARCLVLVAALIAPLAAASPAGAAGTPSWAEAQAVSADFLGFSSPQSVARNDGTQATQEASFENQNPTIPASYYISAVGGVVAQRARAGGDGSSAACAGTLANGSTMVLAADGSCDAGPDGPGAVITLPGAVISGGTVVAACSSDGAGDLAGAATLRSVTVTGPNGEDPVVLPESPAPDTVVRAHGYTFTLNQQRISADGRIEVTAMRTVNDAWNIGGSTGVVSCGLGVVIVGTPVFPIGGAPMLVGLGVIGAAAVRHRAGRRQRRTAATI